MPPKPLIDLDLIDPNHIEAGPEEIRECNPQRYEMEQLDAIVYFDRETGHVAGYKEVEEDEFWVRGHIPGRPLLPGVLMCEAAAQLCSYYYKRYTEADKFLGFGGLQDVKFRRPVQPGHRLFLLGECKDLRSRRAVFDTQGVVDGKVVFQGTIIGMPM